MESHTNSNLIPYTRTVTRTNISDGKGGSYTETTTHKVGDRWLLTRYTNKSDTIKRVKPIGIQLLKNVTDQTHSRWEIAADPATVVRKVNPYTTEVNRAPTTQWLGASLYRPNLPSPNPDNLLLARVKDMKGNLAMVMAEYRETCSLFEATSKTVYQVGVKLARRDFRGLANVLAGVGDDRLPTYWKQINKKRRVSDVHLGYQYGVLPLVDDLEKMTASLWEISRQLKPLYQRISARDIVSGHFSADYQGTDPATNSPSVKTVRAFETRTRRNVMYVTFNPSIHRLSQFGLTNPLHLLWNVIPYSFIVDTMFNVGGYLSSLDAMVGVDSWFGFWTGKNEYSGVVAGLGVGQYKYSGVDYARRTLSCPTPSLRYTPSDSLTQVLNGIALLTQLRSPKVNTED